MENRLVIYLNDDGGISVIHPTLNCGLTVEEIASKDVPSGKPFHYITTADLVHLMAMEHDDNSKL
jgi:hypothetical protein